MAWSSLNDVFIKMSGVNNVDALLSPEHPTYDYELPSLNNTVTYSFSTFEPNADMPTHVLTMTETEKQSVRKALDYVHQVTGIEFKEAADPSVPEEIFFGYSDQIPTANSAIDYWNYNYTTDATGQVDTLAIHDNILVSSKSQYLDLTPGTYGYQVLLHEIGHALGLKHPFEGTPTLASDIDNDNETLMSYTLTGSNHTTYGPLDLTALRWLYGGDGLLGAQYESTASATAALQPDPATIMYMTSLALHLGAGRGAG